jgi:predicted flap endonuclease-1-like 5' DNA nuclease
MASIKDIEGIGPVFQEKLAKAGITTVEGLLKEGASKKGRAAIAAGSDIDEGKILDWVNMADLFRIKGIASQFAELLKASGVDTVKELRNRNAENLHAKLEEVNAAKSLTRVVPSLDKIADFIEQAKNLDPVVTH